MKKNRILLKIIAVFSVIIFYTSQALWQDPRLKERMKQLGILETYVGCSIPLIKNNGKRIYLIKTSVSGFTGDRVIKIGANADDTFDPTFANGGIEIGPEIDFSTFKLPAQNQLIT